jgi:ParB family chromosome partitioning protein
MAKRKTFVLNKELQEGLTQTMTAAKHYAGDLRYEIVPLSQIEFDPDNPRDLAIEFSDLPQGPVYTDVLYKRKMDEINNLNSLAETINKQGLINPIVVYKHGNKYRLIAGERRCLASMIAGKHDIKANILSERPSEYRQRLLQWIENIEREDLSLWERLQNIKMIVSAYQKQNTKVETINANLIKNILGCSLPHAGNYHKVLNADKPLSAAIERREINNLEKAALVAKIENEDLQKQMLTACVAGASLKQMKQLATEEKKITQEKKKQAITDKLAAGRGRKAGRINLGAVKDPIVIQTIIESVVEQDRFRHYHSRFQNLDWNNLTAVSIAFKELLEIIQLIDIQQV